MSEDIIQFIKYVFIGLAGTLIYALVFTILNETIFEINTENSAEVNELNYIVSNTVAFLFSSVFVYLRNKNWVFKPGRHGNIKEISLFYAIALIAYIAGTPTGAYFVSHYQWNEYSALIFTISASVVVNFVGRKFLVFKQ